MTKLSLLPLLTLASAVLAKQDAFQAKCASFGHKIKLPNVHVNFVEYVPGGTNLTLPDNVVSCGASQAVSADMCRVAMAVDTSESSQITLEAWFPRDYTGRFLSTGNGGLGGCMASSRSLWRWSAVVLIPLQASNTMILPILPA
jgi:feruloyl esterase